MRFAVMLEAQEGMTYQQLLDVALRAEALGFDAVYRSDHYSSTADQAAQRSTDAWATLAGLARETSTITLGTLVSPVTFRAAGNLAKVVATVHEMAGDGADGGSRIHLGMGTGWMEQEHRRHGFPFEDVATRFRRLEEHLTAVTGLWDPQRDGFDIDGEFVRLHDARFVEKPQPRPRLIVGGAGLQRTPRLAARFADELNGVLLSPASCAQQRHALQAACAAEGRPATEVEYSVMTGCLIGKDTASFDERVQRLWQRYEATDSVEAWMARRADRWITGDPAAARDRVAQYAQAGVTKIALQLLLHDDLDQLDDIADVLFDSRA